MKDTKHAANHMYLEFLVPNIYKLYMLTVDYPCAVTKYLGDNRGVRSTLL